MNRESTLRRHVVIVQRTLPHYRVPFFQQLRARLEAQNVSLHLVVGEPSATEETRRDTGHLDWAVQVENRQLAVGARTLVWQPVIDHSRGADLIVVEYAGRLLVNYLLTIWRRFGGPRVAFWGHGHNHDRANASRFGEAAKRLVAAKGDWWFCYTEGTARLVESNGVDRRKMTVVQNTTDTESLRRTRESIAPGELAAVRAELGIGGGPVAVSIGSIYPNKRPWYLLEAADHLRRMVPGFELIVIGDGPDRHLLDRAAGNRPWLHVLGAIHGEQLARTAGAASVLLNPGLVGLTIVDAFALGLPIVTCALPFHSPEIEYLEHGVNGLILSGDTAPEQYAAAVARLLACSAGLQDLSRNAASAARLYTMDEMVRRFADGILGALSAPPDQRIIRAVRQWARRWAN